MFFFNIFGSILLFFDPLRQSVLNLTPIHLFVMFILFLWANSYFSIKLIKAIIVIYLIGVLAEVLGVRYNIIFGNYYYGNSLGPQVFEVPLIIGFNWLTLSFATYGVSSYFFRNKTVITIFASILMVLTDYIIEPMAGALDFWYWVGGNIPIQNYVGWFFVSLIIHTILVKMNFKFNIKLCLALLLSQILFFVIQYFNYGFLEHKFFYFLLLALSLSFPLLRSFEEKLSYYKKWIALFPAILTMMAIHIPIDILFTRLGIWSFNNDFVSGVYLFNLPLEEWLFFVIIPFCCVFIYESTNYFFKPQIASQKNLKTSLLIGVILIVLALVFFEKTYTTTYFSFSGIILILIFLCKPKWWKKFQIMFVFSLIPFLIVNGFLTGSFTDQPIVSYNDEQNLGIRLLNIPFEDIFYCFNILVLVVAVYEYQLSKMFSIKNN